MALHDILVLLDEFAHTADRLRLAADLAAAHGATLVGLRVEMHPRLPRQLRTPVVDAAVVAHDAAIRANSDRLKAELSETAKRCGIDHEWWLVEDGGTDDIVDSARYTDIVVVQQHDRSDDEEFPADELIHQLLVRAGRPVLITPNWPVNGVVGSRAVIAWNGSREASRALADAMPLLAKAERTLLVIEGGDGVDERLARVSGHLSRHGIGNVTTQVLTSDDSIQTGGDILRAGNTIDANLLVMGGYGKSRLSEKLFGGVTEFVLYHARLPVLMSH